MMRKATRLSVQGNFAQARLALGGSAYGLREANGAYYITESDLTGKPWEHRVEYTLGDRRVQHYLTTLDDGRIVILPPTWDGVRKKWSSGVDMENPEESGGVQVWNKACYGCHVSRERKNFDLQTLRYATTWGSLGIDCESCHGPGKAHAAKPSAAHAIVNPARLDPARSSMICAECHSMRDIYADGFAPGANYYDYFLPVMEFRLPASDDPAYWPDGRPRWFNNEAVGLWQSQCFLKGGATCVTCHSHPHNPQPAAESNSLCTGCHKAVAAGLTAHTHHAATSAGSSCVACHMPPAAAGLKAVMRDHTMSLPAPENTIRHGIPNACNACHRDRDAQWALGQMTAWYGGGSRYKLLRRADAFTAARQGDQAAIPVLLAILADRSEAPWIRANAAGYLGGFPDDPAAYQAVVGGFDDPDPLVRAIAAGAIRPRAAERESAATALVPLVGDPIRSVRMGAATAMVAMGVQPFPGEQGRRFEEAKQLYRARAELNSDDAGQQFAAGRFFLLAGDPEGAAAALAASLRLDPATPARYLLGRALALKSDWAGARRMLQTIPREDLQYAAAQKLLAEVEARDSSPPGTTAAPAGGANGAATEAKFLNAQVQYQSEYYGAALAGLEEALRVAPDAAWADKARVYRAICLEKLGRAAEAEAAMTTLAGKPGAIQDVDLQLAFVELLFDTGRAADGLGRVDALIRAVPNAPMAHFWRSKLLLQLQRTGEAAAAAEESVRLSPEVPNAHNLLIRIYQMLGRTKEAAEQAEWLRDYERRLKSR